MSSDDDLVVITDDQTSADDIQFGTRDIADCRGWYVGICLVNGCASDVGPFAVRGNADAMAAAVLRLPGVDHVSVYAQMR